MMPLIATKRELDILKAIVDRVAGEVMEKAGVEIPYLVGTMIELPRAALLAGQIAESAEFFSFGTNDLTQTVYGISRDDSASFLRSYQKAGIFERDPFVSIDREGVGEMVRIAAERGRATRPVSSSASAASMAAIRPRSISAARSGSITCRARRTACRSRVSPRRRPNWLIKYIPVLLKKYGKIIQGWSGIRV